MWVDSKIHAKKIITKKNRLEWRPKKEIHTYTYLPLLYKDEKISGRKFQYLYEKHQLVTEYKYTQTVQ